MVYTLSNKVFIDDDKYNKYLLSVDNKNKEIIKTIVENTIYIDTDELVESLKRCILRLEEEVKNYYIFIPDNKIGSEHYILKLLQDYIHPDYIINGYKSHLCDIIKEEYPIVIIDDAIYSSCNMCSHIDNITHHQVCKNRRKYKFYCVTAITSDLNLQVVNNFGAKIITDKVLTHLRPKILLNKYDVNFDYMYKNFGCETESILPVIFRHKIANEFGCYQFYKEILKEEYLPNRECINSITEKEIKELIPNIQIKIKLFKL